MSIRYWIAALVVGLTLVGSHVYAQQPDQTAAENQKPASAADQGTKQEYPDPIDFTPTLERIESAIRDMVPEKDETERERQEARDGGSFSVTIQA